MLILVSSTNIRPFLFLRQIFRDDKLKNSILATVSILTLVAAVLGVIGGTYIAQRNEVQSFFVRWQTSTFNPASRPEFKDQFLTSITDTLGNIRGLRRDTTSVFEIRAYMTAYFYLTDTSSTDSVDQTFFFYTSPKNQIRRVHPAWKHWVLVDSFRVQKADGDTAWVITSSAIPVGNFGMFIGRGNAANKKVTPVLDKITMAVQDNP